MLDTHYLLSKVKGSPLSVLESFHYQRINSIQTVI